MPTHEPESKPDVAQATKTAFITGITGQDGSYLAEALLGKGYTVYGLVRDIRGRSYQNISHILHRLNIVEGHVEFFLSDLLVEIQPDEIYNLAAASFVGKSWSGWRRYMKVNGIGAVNVFEAARRVCPKAHVYQASSSEMFGNSPSPQSEATFMAPRSPYGASKLYAHSMARIYRESYGMHISCGICFNHESPRRGHEFVSRKIAKIAAQLSNGEAERLRLGSLEPRRDWGHAKDYVRAMWMMLQAPEPGDYVVATGASHSVQDFVRLAFSYVGLDWKDYYEKDPQFIRPAEVLDLRGDPSRIKSILGWEPEMNFDDLVMDMVTAELEGLEHDKSSREAPAEVFGGLQGEGSGEAVRGGVSREIGSPEADSEKIRRDSPNLKQVG